MREQEDRDQPEYMQANHQRIMGAPFSIPPAAFKRTALRDESISSATRSNVSKSAIIWGGPSMTAIVANGHWTQEEERRR